VEGFSLSPKYGPGNTTRYTNRASGAMDYPSPYFDIASTFLPSSIKELLEYCRKYFLMDPLINAVVHKMAAYPIRKLIYNAESQELRNQWKTLFEDVLDIRTFQIEAGLDRNTYGNCFISVSFPFHKWLSCSHCGNQARADDKRMQDKWRYVGHKFRLKCPSCNTEGTAFAKDYYYRSYQDIRLVRWSPENINIRQNQLTGHKELIYELDKATRSDISMGKKSLVSALPNIYLEAVKKRKKVRLNPNAVFHMKRASISHPTMMDDWEGWGMPMILPVLKQLFYLQVLRKGNEAIATEYVVPLRVLFPQPGSTTSDPFTTVNLQQWKQQIEEEIKHWRRDHNYIPVMPLPVGNETIGGTGRALMLHQDIRITSEHVLAGMGVPQEFIFGGISYSGSNVSLRQIENEMIGYLEELDGLVRFVRSRVSAHMGWAQIDIGREDFKMGDDLQRSSLKFQYNQAGKLSDQTLLEDIGEDVFEEEQRKLVELKRQIESNKRQQIAQAAIAGEAQIVQAKYMGMAQAVQQQAMMAGPPQKTVFPLHKPQYRSRPAKVPTPKEVEESSRRKTRIALNEAIGNLRAAQAIREAEQATRMPTEAVIAATPTTLASPPQTSQRIALNQQAGASIHGIASTYVKNLQKMDPAQKMTVLKNMSSETPNLYAMVQQQLQQNQGSHADPGMMDLPVVKPPRRAPERAVI